MTTTATPTLATDAGNHEARNIQPVTEALTEVLAATYRLVLKSQIYHWNVTGPQFRAVHEMTEEHYTDMFAAVDELAERIRALDAPALLSPAALAAGPEGQDPDAALSAAEMVRDLASDHDRLARQLRALVEAAESASDPVTADLATARAAIHEKTAWMLHATAA